jgi:phage terminase large subunit GpA-like protein
MLHARSSTEFVPPAHAGLYACLADEVAPREPMTVTQWADTYRVLSSKASGEPGRYSSARTPYLREIMDCLSAESPVQSVVIKKPAQGGATELGLNWIGYVMHEHPVPMLAVVPTLEVRKRWVRQRLDPMLETTPALSEIFDARKSRDGGNSEDLKDFPGGMLILGGANSAASLSSMPICYFLGDEVSRFPWNVGDEGSPLAIIDQRLKAFVRRKRCLISTPTVLGQCLITIEFAVTDQRSLYVPCPHCGTYITLVWEHPDKTLGLEASKISDKVWYICRSCGSGIEEYSKTAMLAECRWVPKFAERKARGYHWNGLYSPLGLGYSWREMLDHWDDAQNDTTKLKAFVNTELGEAFVEDGDSVDHAGLLSRVEQYPDDLLSRLVKLIVAGADVQKDRIEFSVYGFGEGEEAWALDHQVLPGDTADAQVWDDLDEALAAAGVQLAGIDAGYNTPLVNAFVEKRRWCAALKGTEGMNRPLVEDERKRRHRLRQRRKRGVPSEPIGVDTGKAMLYARLRKEKPGPGFIHYPDHPAFDKEFFEQLTAEHLVTKVKNGRPYHEWVKQRPRNEGLDCAVYALATYHLAGVIQPRERPADFAGESAGTSGPRGTKEHPEESDIKSGSWSA